MTLRTRIAAFFLVVGLPLVVVVEAGDQFVYWPLVTDGTEYRRVPYPREAGSLLVLAGTDVAIEARRVPVSYWPITREYLADFSKQPPAVEGSVEIVDASGSVSTVESTPYVMWHPDGVGARPARLVPGEQSEAFYDDYVKAARAATRRTREYRRIVAERQAAVEAWLKIAAERPPNLPKPPPELDIPEPEPFHAFATEPRRAAVCVLPEGIYTVRVRGTDGVVVPGSERELVSFGPRAYAVGYVLRPEDRWTRPMLSFDPSETVYTTGRTDLFLQPVPVAEYETRRFSRLFRPQSVESVDPSLTVWAPRPEAAASIAAADLALSKDGAIVELLPRTAFRVRQLPGASRGFEIDTFAPEAGSSVAADFHAVRIDRRSPASELRLVDGTEAIADSTRQLRHVSPRSEVLLFLPALLPLAVILSFRLGYSINSRATGVCKRGHENETR
ncbi:MAG: hypothetical protein ACR2RL_19125 [Gammaproteobacteria bacterium]